MEHRAVDDAGRQIGRAAATRVERDVIGADAALVVVADAPIGAEIVALAGQREIVVAVEPHLAGPAGTSAPSAAIAAQAQAWLSLPPKPPPMRRVSTVTKASGMPRMRPTMCWTSVGSCVEAWTVISRPSPGIGERDLAFEIEMLLAADGELAFEPMRRGGQRGRDVAAAKIVVGQHARAGLQRVLDA